MLGSGPSGSGGAATPNNGNPGGDGYGAPGAASTYGNGRLFGGGGGGADNTLNEAGNGAPGAVKIIWGDGESFS